MSKKLFAALSLSVLLAACQGSVAPTDDTSMEDENGVMVEETVTETTMEEASTGETVEVEMDAEAEVVAE